MQFLIDRLTFDYHVSMLSATYQWTIPVQLSLQCILYPRAYRFSHFLSTWDQEQG